MEIYPSLGGAARDPGRTTTSIEPFATVLEGIRRVAVQSPDSGALRGANGEALNFGRLVRSMTRLTQQLLRRGAGQDRPVATMFPNGPESALAFLAVIGLAPCAPINADLSSQDALDAVERLGIQMVVTLRGWTCTPLEALRAAGIQVVEIGSAELTEDADLPSEGPEDAWVRASPAPDDVALVLTTSGTTSRPKVVPITHANLAASARNIADWLRLGPDDRSLNVMPLFHVHGLVASVLATLVSGGEVTCTPGFSVSDIFEWIDRFQPTWFTAVPTMHQAIVERARRFPGDVRTGSLRFVRSASSALPPSVAADIEAMLGVPMIEAFGMTEGAHQIASNPLPPGERRWGSVGLAAGTEICVMDEQGAVLASGERGEICIRGGNVVGGYADAVNNVGAFHGAWFRTGDQGVLDEAGYLTITGRLKEIINRGGEKVSPREVDEALLAHPAVAQALTFAVPDRRLGEQVAAAVVLRDAVDEAELRRFAAERLSSFKVPRRIYMLDELPKGPTGKPQRIGMAARLGVADLDDGSAAPDGPTATDTSAGNAGPHTPAQDFLAQLWSEVLRLDQVSIHDRFLDIGGDSLAATRLLARVHEALDVKIPMIDFFDRPTIAAQADLIERILVEEG